MTISILLNLILTLSLTIADEIKFGEGTLPDVNVDKNTNDVLPTYINIDNASEKSIKFSWGTVYYISDTREEDHNHSAKDQTQLNIRYECNNSTSNPLNIQRFSFCGYSKSEVDLNARTHQMNELRKMDEHKNKSDVQLIAQYDKDYNDRIVDPKWSISDQTKDGKTSIQISVRQNTAIYGSCEEKITKISIPVSCK